jgi:putative restriction endonuclease
MRIINKWTREQTIVVFNLYCRIPFNKACSSNPDIINTAKLIGLSANSVKMKIGNFGSFDPLLKEKGIVGLKNASILDRQIWDEFNNNWEQLAYESELIIAKLKNINIEESIETDDIPLGLDKDSFVKIRINQRFFRNTVLSDYNNRCCITGINNAGLLVSSHI